MYGYLINTTDEIINTKQMIMKGIKGKKSLDQPLTAKCLLDAVFWVFLKGVKVLGWMVVIYVILFVVIGGEFNLSIDWENIGRFWDALIGI